MFDVSIAIGAKNPSTLHSMAAGLTSALTLDNGLRFKLYWNLAGLRDRLEGLIPERRMLFTSDELCNLIHLPPGDHSVMKKVPHLGTGERSIDVKELAQGIRRGKAQAPDAKGSSGAHSF